VEEPIPKLGTERNWRENGRGNPHICTELLCRHQSDSSQDILRIAKKGKKEAAKANGLL
jgi:hypothetical protein